MNLQTLAKSYYFKTRDFMLDEGWITGHTDYTKYIILGRSRVGSTLLLNSLRSNRHIHGFGEIFQSRAFEWISTAPRFHGQAEVLKSQYYEQPELFIQHRVFRKYPLHVKAVGFKLFYYHARSEPCLDVWRYLESQTNIKVIHLKRKNRLRTILSREKAARTKNWVKLKADKSTDQSRIKLDVIDCQQEFIRTQEQEAEASELFGKHSVIDVYYEDLVAQYDDTMEQIQLFLGVTPQKLRPITLKQSELPLSQSIVNYSELETAFHATPWSTYFDE